MQIIRRRPFADSRFLNEPEEVRRQRERHAGKRLTSARIPDNLEQWRRPPLLTIKAESYATVGITITTTVTTPVTRPVNGIASQDYSFHSSNAILAGRGYRDDARVALISDEPHRFGRVEACTTQLSTSRRILRSRRSSGLFAATVAK